MGGYYDAGDHVKFGLPMAFTVTMLSWSVIEYADQINFAGELEHALEAIKWGTDYFIKAHTSPNVLWAEVHDFLAVLTAEPVPAPDAFDLSMIDSLFHTGGRWRYRSLLLAAARGHDHV